MVGTITKERKNTLRMKDRVKGLQNIEGTDKQTFLSQMVSNNNIKSNIMYILSSNATPVPKLIFTKIATHINKREKGFSRSLLIIVGYTSYKMKGLYCFFRRQVTTPSQKALRTYY